MIDIPLDLGLLDFFFKKKKCNFPLWLGKESFLKYDPLR